MPRAASRQLPSAMRDVGDAVLKSEWRQHRRANPRYLEGFYECWLDYLRNVLTAPDGEFGADIHRPDEKLSEDQLRMLQRLKDEVYGTAPDSSSDRPVK